ncbi:hypothetical protein WMF30_10815 [Sorangium sp. So ce134]
MIWAALRGRGAETAAVLERLMSDAAPLLPSPFDRLPPHLREAGERHGFGARPGAELRVLHVRGTLWYCDGATAIDSGIPATGQRPRCSDLLEGLVEPRPRPAEAPEPRGDVVHVSWAVIPASCFMLAAELFPGASWAVGWYWADAALKPVAHALAIVSGIPVALVMPIRQVESGTLVKA